jgi:hypothetical protein
MPAYLQRAGGIREVIGLRNEIIGVTVKRIQEVPEHGGRGEKKHRDNPEIVVGFNKPADLKSFLGFCRTIADQKVWFS